LGDNADMCIIELVDYNTLYTNDTNQAAAKKTRRSRKGVATATTAPAAKVEAKASAPVEEVKTEEAKPEDTSSEEKAE